MVTAGDQVATGQGKWDEDVEVKRQRSEAEARKAKRNQKAIKTKGENKPRAEEKSKQTVSNRKSQRNQEWKILIS